MKTPSSALLASCFAMLLLRTGASQGDEASAEVSFKNDIARIFVDNCYACHNPKVKKGKLDMSSYQALFEGGSKGDALVPGSPDESLLALMMHGDELPAMPKDADLLDSETVAKVDEWIKQGAKFDGSDEAIDIRELAPPVMKKEVATNYTTPTPITAIAFRPDKSMLAASGYHEITLWNPQNGALLKRIPTKAERIHALDFSPDGKRLVHAGGTPGSHGEVVVWDVDSAAVQKELFSTNDVIFAATFSPDGSQVAAGGTDRLFRVWNVESGEEQHKVENHADWILAIAFSHDGKRIFTASRDKSAKIWDQSTKEPILTFPAHTDGVYGIGVSPDGAYAVSTGADRHLRFWETSGEGKQTKDIGAHDNTALSLRFPKSGKLIFTTGADKRLRSWNPADGKLVRSFEGHKDWVYSLAVSSDDTWVATGAWDGEIKVWEVDSGNVVSSFVAIPALATPKPNEQPTEATAAK